MERQMTDQRPKTSRRADTMPRSRTIAALLSALIATMAVGAVGGAQEASPEASPAPTEGAAAVIPSPIGDPRPAPELAGLVYPDLTPFDLVDLQGSPILLYFGYTHCPDVCPATLGELFGVWEESPDMQAVYITVDPERDTPEFLTEWTRYLPENLHALTGSPGAIRRAAENFGVRYARVETTSTSGYTMSHTAELYLIDKHGQLLLSYPFGTPAAEIAADIAVLQAD
jgi:protein SCO1